MIISSNKSKQLLVQLVKISIVVAAFYFIYVELANNDQLNWRAFLKIVAQKKSLVLIMIILSLSFANRFLEILKWQNLVASFDKISIAASTKQVLAALTLGVFTPVGSGEYAGKALYYKRNQTSEIIFLNVICNGIQMVMTAFFGFIGLLILGYYSYSMALLLTVVVVCVLYFYGHNVTIKGYSLKDFTTKTKHIPIKIHIKNAIFGLLRYLVFTHQYLLLLFVFGAQIDYFT